VDTFVKGDDASNFFLHPEPTVVFAADQSVRIDTTCNTATGRYSVDKDRLTVSNVTFSSQPCTGAAKSADSHLRSLFRAGALTFEIAAGRLTLGTTTLGVSAIAGGAEADQQ
jgi:heat shock protein HslJ